MKQYTICPLPNISECFRLIVAPKAEDIRIEIRKYLKKIDHCCRDMYLERTEGMFVPSSTWERHEYPGTFSSNMFGSMFLAEEKLGIGYVTHECLHAAMAHERLRVCFDMNYGDDCNDNEERLAYYLTDCVREVWNTLLDNGHVKKDKN